VVGKIKRFLKEVSYAHQDCIYEHVVNLWDILTIKNNCFQLFFFSFFFLKKLNFQQRKCLIIVTVVMLNVFLWKPWLQKVKKEERKTTFKIFFFLILLIINWLFSMLKKCNYKKYTLLTHELSDCSVYLSVVLEIMDRGV